MKNKTLEYFNGKDLKTRSFEKNERLKVNKNNGSLEIYKDAELSETIMTQFYVIKYNDSVLTDEYVKSDEFGFK